MCVKFIIEIIMACVMIMSIIGIFIRTIVKNKGIGARLIQFTCVSFIIPSIVILGLENVLQGETIATIIGGLIGYVLSGVGDFKGAETNKNDTN